MTDTQQPPQPATIPEEHRAALLTYLQSEVERLGGLIATTEAALDRFAAQHRDLATTQAFLRAQISHHATPRHQPDGDDFAGPRPGA